jgi:hypothetical protein
MLLVFVAGGWLDRVHENRKLKRFAQQSARIAAAVKLPNELSQDMASKKILLDGVESHGNTRTHTHAQTDTRERTRNSSACGCERSWNCVCRLQRQTVRGDGSRYIETQGWSCEALVRAKHSSFVRLLNHAGTEAC